jgi:hypothetical protein
MIMTGEDTHRVSPGVSGAVRRFAGWVGRGSVGHPLLDGIDYLDDLIESPSHWRPASRSS